MSTYQTRKSSEWPWQLVGNEHALRVELQRAGMRHGEVTAHVADLDAGHVLTADNGREFRATGEHSLVVFNGLDVPDAIASQVMALLAPYDPDCYTRPADRDGRAL